MQGLQKECLLVKVAGSNYRECVRASKIFAANNFKGAYGKGLISDEKDPYKTTRVGLLGEMAFGIITNKPVNTEYKEHGDSADFWINGNMLDVKCASKKIPINYILHTNEYGKKLYLKQCIFVYAFLENEDRSDECSEIVLTGFNSEIEVSRSPVRRGKRGKGHLNYEVSFASTYPIHELIEIIKDS